MSRLFSFLFIFSFLLSSCSGLDFSHLSSDAANFHPKRIAVFPETLGIHESARNVVSTKIRTILNEKGWYENIVEASRIKTPGGLDAELEKQLGTYIQTVNTSGLTDPETSRKLGRLLNADAFFLSDVMSWGYGRLDGNKVCRVALSVKLIDAKKGVVIWKASHEIVEDYWMIKPKLDEIAGDLLNKLIKEMPH